ncbi:hypothetical protein GCM10010232_02180 [Streptomyces amakusaensis]
MSRPAQTACSPRAGRPLRPSTGWPLPLDRANYFANRGSALTVIELHPPSLTGRVRELRTTACPWRHCVEYPCLETEKETPLSKNSSHRHFPVKRDRLATPADIAAYLGVPVKTLYQWKYRGMGPKVHKVGRHLRYRWAEVDEWLAAQSAFGLTA